MRGGAQDTADRPAFLRFTPDPASVLFWRLWLGRQAGHLCRVSRAKADRRGRSLLFLLFLIHYPFQGQSLTKPLPLIVKYSDLPSVLL